MRVRASLIWNNKAEETEAVVTGSGMKTSYLMSRSSSRESS